MYERHHREGEPRPGEVIPERIDDYVDENSLVRVVDVFIDRLGMVQKTDDQEIIALRTGFDVIIDEKLSLIGRQCHFSMLRHGGASFKALLSHSAHHRLQLARRGIRLVKAGRLARLAGC